LASGQRIGADEASSDTDDADADAAALDKPLRSLCRALFTAVGMPDSSNVNRPLADHGLDSLLTAKLWSELQWHAAKRGYDAPLPRPTDADGLGGMSMAAVAQWLAATTAAADEPPPAQQPLHLKNRAATDADDGMCEPVVSGVGGVPTLYRAASNTSFVDPTSLLDKEKVDGSTLQDDPLEDVGFVCAEALLNDLRTEQTSSADAGWTAALNASRPLELADRMVSVRE
jgi:hypothetical protein